MTETEMLAKGWTDAESFRFWVPAQAVKLSKANKDKKGPRRWIQGIASTSTKDLQGEVVVQHGIDFDYFLKHGFFNNDHKPGFENKVGQPTECKLTPQGLWVKGFLFENKKISDDIWEMLHSLESTPGATRRIGFSIEGKVKRRSGNKIDSCWIQDIAITPAPVNTTTWAEIAKSLSAQPWVSEAADVKPTNSSAGRLTLSETASYIEELGLPPEHSLIIAKSIFAEKAQELTNNE